MVPSRLSWKIIESSTHQTDRKQSTSWAVTGRKNSGGFHETDVNGPGQVGRSSLPSIDDDYVLLTTVGLPAEGTIC
jgi:hypothetical protein